MLVLPAASVCLTASVHVPSPLSVSVSPPAAQAGVVAVPVGEVRVHDQVPPLSPVSVYVGVVTLLGPAGPVTSGADGATVSSR